MTRIGRLIGAALLSTLFLGPWVEAQGQGDCQNETLYPSGAITPNASGMVTTISDISYEVEYSHITGILAGASYEFTLGSGGYITVREGSYDGPVIGQGSANVTVTATTTDDIFPHWNTNEDCGTASNGFTTTVQLLLDCEPPTATYTYVEDCDLGAYYIDLDITSTGDGATVDVIVEQFGTPTVTEDVGIGVIQFGPFFPGDDPIVTVAHESDPLCNLPLGLLVPFSGCPITVFCNGPALQQQYCYGNNEVRSWLYVGTGAGTMRLSFTAGGIQGAFGDSLRIYDGTDATGTLLYEHLGTGTTDLTGVVVNGTSGSMYMTMVSNATTSCADGGFNINEWFWEVGCGDCTQPEGTATLVTDCATETFVVEVDITSLGDATAATINYSVNGGDLQQLANLGLGITPVGPFPHGDVVDLVLQHGTNAFCEVDLGSFSDPGDCPNLITCGAPAEVLDYCYTANDAKTWLYESVGSGTLRLRFLRGTIESSNFDDLRIYDGLDNTAPLLFEHNNTTAWNLGPVGSAVVSPVTFFYAVEVYATSANLFMEMSSDGSGQCAGSTTYDSWEWEVVCLDCNIPQASVSVVDDCPNNQFSIPVVVTSTGDGAIVNITYTVNGGDPQTVVDVGVGTADLGPFTVGDVVNVTVEHENNPLCNVEFGDLTDTGECPTLVVCGEVGLEETYCYVASDAQDWHYQASGAGTMRLRFLRGTIESNTYDDLRIYDGPDNTAPLLFEHNNTVTWNLGPVGSAVVSDVNLFYAVEVFATGTDLYMEMSSDGSVQCNGSTTYDSWEWEVVCLDCTLPQATYTVVDDCENEQFSIPVTITTTGDGSIVNIVYTVNGGDPQTVVDVGVGTADLGPFALNDTVNVTVEHESNFLCNREFGNITDTGTCPDLVDCGTELSGALCYNNNADRRYYYRGTGTFPLAVFFDAGLLYAGDSLIVYDGGDITAPRLYAGTNVNVTSLFRNTTNAEHRLTIQVKSNGFTSCLDGFEPEALEWRISCLDCVPAMATFNYVQDCANFQYFIDVAINDLGTDPEAGIITTATQDTLYVTETGTIQLGPFVSGTEVDVTILNDANSLCNVYSGTIVNPLCPDPVECPGDAIMETYCYTASDSRAWAYELQGTTGTLRLTFDRGTIESATFDRIYIFDGPDNTFPILWSNDDLYPAVGGDSTGFVQQGTGNLGPDGSAILNTQGNYFSVDISASGQNLYMEMSSDGSVQCGNGTYDEWEWQVYCINCTTPQATVNIIEDCFHRQYSAEVIVTEAGGDAGLMLTNSLQGDTIMDAVVGVYTFGPYGLDSLSYFEITNQDYVQCRQTSDTLTFASDSCIVVSCGSDNYDHCYENNEDRWYTYQAAEDYPITIGFLQGQMLSGDRIVLYNGRDGNAPVLYTGNNGGNLTGFALNSANLANTITLRIQSDGSGSCEDGQVLNELRWAVQCGAVGLEEITSNGFAVYPNPTEGLLRIELGTKVTGALQFRAMDMSGRTVLDQPLMMNGGTTNVVDMGGLQSGQYLVQLITPDRVMTERVQVVR